MRLGLGAALCGVVVFGLTACGSGSDAPGFNHGATVGLTKALSADDLEGRGAGTEGNAAARALIVERMKKLELTPVLGRYEHAFTYGPFRTPEGEDAVPDKPGINVMGVIRGSQRTGLVMVVTAHYDHLGIREGEIYNGADDNASGVSGMLAIADYFSRNQPTHDVLFVAFDAEEDGFGGARAFIAEPPVPLSAMAFNLNLDMIARGDNGILWASGASHWPALKPMIEEVATVAPVTLSMGFDSGDGRADWTLLSDHAVFFRAGIPHLYLGVEDHPDYHKPGDDFDKIDQDWFLDSVETALRLAIKAEENLPDLYAMKAD
ncbi:M28 family peptidase [Hyphomonas sp. FCG-A18]|uniref:M28 family peptidase n=1 Tax=Hyphomonas sp. FCG-A18 TaxID=3080019 RepID=UPI002B2CF8C6|nr:M28 family peptidase [Hyphomonas sp. FCG-A18]